MPPHRDAMELLWRATQCQSWTGQLEWMQDAERVWLKDERRKRKEEMAEIARLNKKARLEDVLKFENHSEMFKGMMIAVKRRVLS